MSEDKSQEQNAPEQQEEGNAAEVFDTPSPDAAHYVLQPTSYRLPERVMTLGDMPDDRFMEEVYAGGDEEEADTFSVDAHPAENQPVKGIAEGDELPDTTGSAALRAEKRNQG